MKIILWTKIENWQKIYSFDPKRVKKVYENINAIRIVAPPDYDTTGMKRINEKNLHKLKYDLILIPNGGGA